LVLSGGAKRCENTFVNALLLAEEIEKRGIKEHIHLKKGVIGSERWGEKMRQRIKTELGIELYDIYGLTEIYGPGIGINSRRERRSSASAHMIFPELSPKSVRAAAVIHGLT